MMRRLPILLGSMALFAGAWACDSLTDPNKSDPAPAVTTAEVTGALITKDGTPLPGNAHVAIFWRTTEGLFRGGDARVVNGRFTLTLATPPASALEKPNDDPSPPVFIDDAGVTLDAGPAAVEADASLEFKSLRPSTIVSGSIGGDLEVGYAGLVVYTDDNGNGQLDFVAPDRVQSDHVIGGNRELTFVYLRGAGNFDLEKLAREGTRPTNGYNLSWSGDAQHPARWFPFDAIELYVGSASALGLSSDVCAHVFSNAVLYTDAGVALRCDPDGYGYLNSCYTQAPDPDALCSRAPTENPIVCLGASVPGDEAGCAPWDGGPEILDAGPYPDDAPYFFPDASAGNDDAGVK